MLERSVEVSGSRWKCLFDPRLDAALLPRAPYSTLSCGAPRLHCAARTPVGASRDAASEGIRL